MIPAPYSLRSRLKAPVFAALDLLSLAAAYNLAGALRGVVAPTDPVLLPLWLPAVLTVASLHLVDAYSRRTDMMSLDYTSHHLTALAAMTLATLVATFVVAPPGFPLQQSRAVILIAPALLAPLTLSYRRYFHARAARARAAWPLVFVGEKGAWQTFADDCRRLGMSRPLVHAQGGEELTSLLERIRRGDQPVEALVLKEAPGEDSAGVHPRTLEELYFAGVPTFTLELFHEVYWRKIPLYRLNQTWLFQGGFRIAREPVFERIKRAADVGLSLLFLALTLPVLLLSALAIRLDDGGPVFFRQTRVGRNRTPFVMLKFRTMTPSGPDGDPYTGQADPRVTRVGRFLRRTRMDEFPQLWNVVRGDMSLIGPRAEWDRLVARYEERIPCYHYRHLVRPGITGWAQIQYPYGADLEDTRRKLEYDLYYIRHFSFFLDASIVLKTIHVMVFGKGR